MGLFIRPISNQSSMQRLLVFAFEKFDKLSSNPSMEVGKHLSHLAAENYLVQFEVLPAVMKSKKNHPNSFVELKESIDAFKPHWIIGLGASSRPRVSVEEIAVNRVDSPKPDNRGTIFRHEKINSSSPLALSTRVDVKKLVNALKSTGVPATISYFADTFVCNYTYFKTLDYLQRKKLKTNCVFIHVPLSPVEVNALDANAPSFPPSIIAEALAAFLKKAK
jgi:pyroglutamyl-peptidase